MHYQLKKRKDEKKKQDLLVSYMSSSSEESGFLSALSVTSENVSSDISVGDLNQRSSQKVTEYVSESSTP